MFRKGHVVIFLVLCFLTVICFSHSLFYRPLAQVLVIIFGCIRQ